MVTPRKAFGRQKYSADKNGRGFYFTFEEWVNWWEVNLGPDWILRRGPRPNQYCMARNGDVGPYALWNVQCKTNAENKEEQVAPTKGEKNYWAKLSKKEVLFIRRNPNLRVKDLAVRFKVHHTTITKVRRFRTWKHLRRPIAEPS